MRQKKDIPHRLLSLANEVKKTHTMIHQVADSQTLLTLKDNDPRSNFYFSVVSQNISNDNSVSYNIQYFPLDLERIKEEKRTIKPSELPRYINGWVQFIKEYDETPSIFDDPILNAYEEELEQQFNIIDADADVKPFTIKQQLFLDQYLEKSIEKLEELKKSKPDGIKEEISDIQKDAQDIKNNMSKETKRAVFKRLKKFAAKAAKIGLDIFKELAVSVAAETVKGLLQ